MEIIVSSLLAILLVAQFFLSIKQIKKGAPDGKILLIITIIVFVIWTPLCILMFLKINKAITTAWYIVSGIYTVFTVWYTNNLQKSMK